MSNNEFFEIAVLVSGIDEEYQNSIIDGIVECAKDNDVNISVFSSFGGVLSDKKYDTGEYNIYELINYDKFDGLILLTNTIANTKVRAELIKKAEKSALPAAILDCDEHPVFTNISIDNCSAMREIVKHVIAVHDAKTINYISGPLANSEAQDRFDAFVQVMEEFGLDVDEDRIYYGDFRAIDGKNAIDKMIRSGQKIPDAVICANDAMALAAVAELERYGYNVPEHVIVTGFDDTYNAKHHFPSITTVSRPLHNAGYQACETVIGKIEGTSSESNIVLEAMPVYRESCGCKSEFSENLPNYKKSVYKTLNRINNDISMINHITRELAEASSPEECYNTINAFIDTLNCDRFSLCLCSDWNRAYRKDLDGCSEDDYQINGYAPIMSAPLIWDKGTVTSINSFRSTDMFPILNSTGGNVNYFLPLHYCDRCIGYYIITNSDFPTHSPLCHSFMMSISNSLENVRKIEALNRAISELDRLFTMDPLCNIYNRNGFIRLADKMLAESVENDTSILISFIDMDGLKMINDNFGHKEGDFALQTLAAVISKCCNNDKICARFGGDEFIVFGVNSNEKEIRDFESDFNLNIKQTNMLIQKPYELGASIGTIVTKADSESKLFQLISRADELMYEKKKKKKTSRYLRKE